jgi:hypothetical protein
VILDTSQPYGPLRPVTGIDLPYIYSDAVAKIGREMIRLTASSERLTVIEFNDRPKDERSGARERERERARLSKYVN